MEIKLKKIHIQNFKGCKEREVEFGENTRISGANATGKTTVFDAFTWLLFNKDSLGVSQFDIRPKNSDGKMLDNVEITVEAMLEIDYGNDVAEYVLKKVQKQKWVKKRGTDTVEFQGNINEFEINGYPKSEKEFKEFIGSIIDEKVFNLVTNPTAFNALPWKEQREMLMKFVGNFTDVQIAEECGNRFSKLLPELKLASTDDILKKYTKAKSTLNKDMVEIPARIDEISKQLVIVDVGALKIEKAAKEVALQKVEDELSGDSSKLEEIHQKQQKIMELKFKSSEILNNTTEDLMNERREALNVVNEKESAVLSARKNISNLESEIVDAERARDCAESDKQKYAIEWRREKANTFPEMKPFPEYTPLPELTEKDLKCPTCGQNLPSEVRENRIKDYQNRKKKSEIGYSISKTEYEERYRSDKEKFEKNRENNLKSITEKGQKAADDVRIYQKQIDEKKADLEKLKEGFEISEKEFKEMKEALNAIPTVADMSDNEEYQNVRTKIASLESEIEELSKESSGNTELKAKREVLKDEIAEIEMKIKSADNSKIEARIAELEAEKSAVGQKIAEQEQMIALTEDFIRTKMNRISSVINEKFRIVSFKLFDNQINGGLKECCECTVNGIPFSSLNNGHRIIAGLDIIRSLSELNGVSCPVFIDNSEAVNENNFPEMQSQMICLVVTDDKELKVEVQ